MAADPVDTAGPGYAADGREGAPRAVLHDIRYARFTGQLRSRPSAVAALARSDVRRSLGLGRGAGSKVWPFLLLAVAWLPAVAVVVVPLLVPVVELAPTELLSYSALLTTDAVVLLAFTATVVPPLLTRDRRDRVLSLYYATALSWVEYLVGTALAALVLLGLVLLGPLLVLFVGSVVTAAEPGAWFLDTVSDLPRLVAAAGVVALYQGSLALALGSLTARRVLAVGGYLALVLVGPAVTAVLALVLDAEWPQALDPSTGPIRLASAVLDPGLSPPGAFAWSVWAAVVVVAGAVLVGRCARGGDA